MGSQPDIVFYNSTTAGVSGGTIPAAFATAVRGAIVADNGISWFALSADDNLVDIDFQYTFFGSLTPASSMAELYNNGLPKALTMTMPNINPVINTDEMSYFLWIYDDDEVGLFHSLSITMTGISSMRPSV